MSSRLAGKGACACRKTGFQHPASAVAPRGHRRDEEAHSQGVAPDRRTALATIISLHGAPDDPERIRRLTHNSSLRETVLEKRFQYEVGVELLARDVDFNFLEAAKDRDGYDVVIDAGPVTRHIQLKGMIAGGRRRAVDVNTRLALRPAGCVVWLITSPDLRIIEEIRWFGGGPAERLPDLSDRPVRHTRANSLGTKAERPALRSLPASRFERLPSMSALVDRLFGKVAA